MISIICVFNNIDKLKQCLLDHLEKQTTNYELILLDNVDKKFKSAAEALNYGGSQANGEYLMFVHQDIELHSNIWLQETEEILNGLHNVGIVGVAGIANKKTKVVSNIKHGNPPTLAGDTQLFHPLRVQTVDECLFFIPKNLFLIYHFDEINCHDWHLYAVDYSLSINIKGFSAYVIPQFVFHNSLGLSMSPKYYITMRNLLKKHKKYYRIIYTTMGTWYSYYPIELQMIVKKIKNKFLMFYNDKQICGKR